MHDLLGLLDLQKLRHAHLLTKLASLAQTIPGLLDLRKLRLTHSLARTEPCLIAETAAGSLAGEARFARSDHA